MRLFFAMPVLFSVLAATALPSGSNAQVEAQRWGNVSYEATIYRDANYQGPAVTVSRPDPDVRLAWPVYSIRVTRGAWQLCSEPGYRGQCVTLTQSRPVLTGSFGRGNILRSIRPLGSDPGGGGGGGGGGGNPGPSLRGMAAEFYTRPMDREGRVLACPRGSATAACASRTADEFCRNQGWTASAREAMETENRRTYLADVLCSRTGR